MLLWRFLHSLFGEHICISVKCIISNRISLGQKDIVLLQRPMQVFSFFYYFVYSYSSVWAWLCSVEWTSNTFEGKLRLVNVSYSKRWSWYPTYYQILRSVVYLPAEDPLFHSALIFHTSISLCSRSEMLKAVALENYDISWGIIFQPFSILIIITGFSSLY